MSGHNLFIVMFSRKAIKIELSEKMQYPFNPIRYSKIINNIIMFRILKKYYKKMAKLLLKFIEWQLSIF